MFLWLPNTVSMNYKLFLFSVSHKAFLDLSLPVSVISFPTTLPLAHAPARLALSTSGLIYSTPLDIFTGCALCL